MAKFVRNVEKSVPGAYELLLRGFIYDSNDTSTTKIVLLAKKLFSINTENTEKWP